MLEETYVDLETAESTKYTSTLADWLPGLRLNATLEYVSWRTSGIGWPCGSWLYDGMQYLLLRSDIRRSSEQYSSPGPCSLSARGLE